MAAYASLVSLMHLIQDLEHHPSPPISLDRRLVESITQHITFFQEFLHDYNSPPNVSDHDEDAADPLEMCIADAAYAAEDAIESHIVDTVQQLRSNNDDGSKITRLLSCFRSPKEPNNAYDEKIESINLCCVLLQSVVEEMDLIKKAVLIKVDTEKTNKKKMEVEVEVVHGRSAMTNVPEYVARNETMVGSDDVLLDIMEKLTGGRPYRQVIPIVGMGGIGKTFLARSIYKKPLIKEHFDIRAWATISQDYNTGEILCDLLSQATKIKKEQLSWKSEDVLGLELHKYLSGRRFLIVMDDMWSVDAWDMVQRFLPDKGNGSRVLVTTRLSQLSSELNNNYSLHMSFLDEASSWSLFSKIVFGEKSCPSKLKNIGEKIVQNCRGLPLSITVVGGLLKKMDDTRASWESIRDNLTSVVNMQNDEHCLRLLKLSYNHLPVYLKPCFMYMGVFDEDDEIPVSTIIKLWVSEGFLKPTNGEALESTARGFLQDLIDRNLILICYELGITGNRKYCKIHDLVRDICLKEGQKEGFYHVIGQCNPPPRGMNTQRRVVILRNTSKKKIRSYLRSMSHARSIICEHGKVSPCQNVGLLRILHNYRKFSPYNNKSYVQKSLVCSYVNLRHLVINSRVISSFLPSVSLLWNLHTFIVSCPSKHTLFADIWKMPQIRHIDFVYDYLCLPDPPCDGREVIMENLHTLKGVMNFKCSEGVVNRIPNIKKLGLRYEGLLGTDNNDEHCVGNIKFLCRLESLSVSLFKVPESNIYMQKLTFPHSLKKLSLCMDGKFEWDDMLKKIGSLPHLENLRLWLGRFGKGKWETAEGQFPCLKYLGLISCSGLEEWTAAEEGSILPRLEHLRLFGLEDLKKIPCELGNIDTLKRIWMTYCGEGAVKSAKEMVDEQVELQGGEDQLSFHVAVILVRKDEHLKSLSSPNFHVK